MKFYTLTKKTSLLIYAIIIVLPFLLFYWMIPFVTDLTLGKDYQEYSIQNQMELLFALKTGTFPLYVPGYALGHSSSALTLGQIFHPLPHIASFLPGYWDGKALQWNTFLRLLSLGVTHLILFVFLRQLKLNITFSFLLSLITIYNLRMLDLFRFGASLESYTGYILLCIAIGWYFLRPTRLAGPLCIIGATYWLICSGHPTMMYYGFIGAGLFLIVAPLFISTMLNKNIDFKYTLKFWTKNIFYITLGILLSSAYTLPFYFDFIKANTLRTAKNYTFSLTSETFFGTLSNFFMPFYSEVHSAFGGSSLFLLAVMLPILRCFKIRITYSIWVIWGILLFAFLHMQGSRTPIHRWVWENLPFASSVRGEGRISLIMPFFIMMILAWLINIRPFTIRFRKILMNLSPLSLLAFLALLLIPLYILFSYLFKPALGSFTPHYIREIPLILKAITLLLGMISLVSLIFYNQYPQKTHIIGLALCIATCLQIGLLLKYGTFIAKRHNQPSFEQMKSQKRIKLDYLYNPGAGMYSSVVLNQLDHSFLEPFLGKIYTQIIPISSQAEAYRMMSHERTPQQAFIEEFDPDRAKSLTNKSKDMKNGTVELIYASYNRLIFRVFSETPAIFGFSYPYTGHWKTWVNGIKSKVYRANGATHAVEIPKGESLIEFRYWSNAAFLGILISCLTFIMIGLYFSFKLLIDYRRVIISTLVAVIGILIPILWTYSLYNGDNLKTEYVWTYVPPKTPINIAYGKKTKALPVETNEFYRTSNFYYTHWSRIVDGDKNIGSGYIIQLQQNPSVIIDLSELKKINSIVIYKSIKKHPISKGYIEISVSQDEKQWDKVASLRSKIINSHHPIHIKFDSPKITRYVQIKVSGYGNLNLDEVEVY